MAAVMKSKMAAVTASKMVIERASKMAPMMACCLELS
jgi:hypothetical protein